MFLKHKHALVNIFKVICTNVIKYTEIMELITKWNYYYLLALVLLLIDFGSMLGCIISKTAFSVALEYKNVTCNKDRHTKFTFYHKQKFLLHRKGPYPLKNQYTTLHYAVSFLCQFYQLSNKYRHMTWKNHLISNHIVNVANSFFF